MYVHHDQAVVDRVLALVATGVPKLTIANDLGINVKTVRRWVATGGIRQPRREQCSGTTCRVREAVDRASYAYLLGMYLGDGHIVHTRRSFRLEIACDPKYPGIIEEAMDAIRGVLPANRVLARVRPHVVMVGVYSNHLPCLFPQHGPGLKHTRPIALEPWQTEIALDELPGPFIRGLVHSDGCRALNRVRGANGNEYEYPRYMFSNRSDDIRGLFVAACDRLGIASRRMNRWNQSVNDREGVRRLDEIVGAKY